MKRFHILWLCLALLLTTLPALAETPQVGDRLVRLENDYVNSAALAGDQIWLLGGGGLYRWAPGEEKATRVLDLSDRQSLAWQPQPPEDPAQRALWEQAVSRLFSDGKELLGIQPHTLQVFALEGESWRPRWQLPTEELQTSDEQPPQIRQLAFQEGRLWLLLGQEYGPPGDFTGIAAFDPESGTLSKYELPLAQSLTAGPKGQLLLWQRPEDPDQPEQGGLFIFDIAAGKPGTRLLPYDNQTTAFAWDAQGARLLYWQAGQLMALSDQGETTALNYLALDAAFPGLEAFALPGQGYALQMGSDLIVQDASGERTKDRVVIRTRGLYGAHIALQYMAEHPEVVIHALEDQDGDGILASLTARSDEVDIYQTQTLPVFQSAMEKGYALPLTDPQLLAKADELLQPLQGLVRPEGQLYGFPTGLQPQTWTINLNKWAELDLGERPATLLQAFRQYQTWQEDHAESNPEHVYLSPYQDIGFYIDFVVNSYILSHAREDEPLRFDTPAFRQALDDLEVGRQALSLTPEQEQIAMGGQYELLMTYSPGNLGEVGMDGQSYESVLPLAITEGEPRVFTAELSLIFVHANSQHPEVAQDYINFYLDQLDEANQAQLFPARAKPLRQPNYEQLMKEQQARLDEARAAAAAASDSGKRALQDKVQEEEARLARYDRNLWKVSPRSIALQQALLPQLRFPGPHAATLYAQRHDSLAPIIRRYAQGQLPRELFISELEGVARLVYLEGK